MHLMIDLETLGTRPGSVILSLGAIAFGPGAPTERRSFYQVFNRSSCRGLGLTEDPDTLTWWESQTEAAREVLGQANDHLKSVSLTHGLADFRSWLWAHGAASKVRVWGNGSDFDNVLLVEAFRATGLEVPWRFYNNRCYRTIKNLVPSFKANNRGTRHNALDDAVAQANHLVELAQLLKLDLG